MATGEPILNIVNSTMLNAGLTKIADAIRAKGGTTEQLAFPDGMADAIAAIEAGGDISPFSSAKFGTFTAVGSKVTTVTIDGISSCKIFAMRQVITGGVYEEISDNVVSTVVVNTGTWENYIGASTFFSSRALTTFADKLPTLSGDTLTFDSCGCLLGTYEYVMVS